MLREGGLRELLNPCRWCFRGMTSSGELQVAPDRRHGLYKAGLKALPRVCSFPPSLGPFKKSPRV